MKSEYEKKLSLAKDEADAVIKSAVETANMRSGSIVSEANERARHIMEKSQKQIEADKKTALDEAKNDIASMAIEAAEKNHMQKFEPRGRRKTYFGYY